MMRQSSSSREDGNTSFDGVPRIEMEDISDHEYKPNQNLMRSLSKKFSEDQFMESKESNLGNQATKPMRLLKHQTTPREQNMQN